MRTHVAIFLSALFLSAAFIVVLTNAPRCTPSSPPGPTIGGAILIAGCP